MILLRAELPTASPEPPHRQHSQQVLPQAATGLAGQVETLLSRGEIIANGKRGGNSSAESRVWDRQVYFCSRGFMITEACATQNKKSFSG